MNKKEVADPSALGLLGLAIVTLVASSSKLGITSGVSLIIPWAIFAGAFAQLFAAINDAKIGNKFGSTAFGGFSFFWFGVAMTWMLQSGVFGESLALSADSSQLGFAYLAYLIFTTYMMIGSLTTSKALFFIFALIECLFIGLTLSSFGVAPEFFHMFAAVSELLIALLAFYASACHILNEQFGKTVLPLGKPFVCPLRVEEKVDPAGMMHVQNPEDA